MPVYRLPLQRNPLARFISLLVFIVVAAVAVALGAVTLLIVLGLPAFVSLRYWWLRRRGTRGRPASGAGDYIEGEYTVKKEEPRRRE
jgi:hypothetical protein